MSKKSDKQPILVPVDFSPNSESALTFAVELGDSLKAPIIVLHVVHDPGEAPGYYQVKGRKKQLRLMADVAQEMLEEFMKKMKKKLPHLKAMDHASDMLVAGLPVTRILEVVERVQPGMVVMGSAGRTGLSRVLLGSKAEQVVRLCPAPVTIVKTSPNNKKEKED